MFYQGASHLEESFPVSKGSVLQIHHGCLAHAQLREGRVDSVHYHAVPPSYAGHDHCDAIFEATLGDSPSGWRAEDSQGMWYRISRLLNSSWNSIER